MYRDRAEYIRGQLTAAELESVERSAGSAVSSILLRRIRPRRSTRHPSRSRYNGPAVEIVSVSDENPKRRSVSWCRNSSVCRVLRRRGSSFQMMSESSSLPQVSQSRVETRSAFDRARHPFVLKDLHAPSGGQRVELQIQALVGGRDAGVADEGHGVLQDVEGEY